MSRDVAESMFELRLAASLKGIRLQYRCRLVQENSWGDITNISNWTDWWDVPTVAIEEK